MIVKTLYAVSFGADLGTEKYTLRGRSCERMAVRVRIGPGSAGWMYHDRHGLGRISKLEGIFVDGLGKVDGGRRGGAIQEPQLFLRARAEWPRAGLGMVDGQWGMAASARR